MLYVVKKNLSHERYIFLRIEPHGKRSTQFCCFFLCVLEVKNLHAQYNLRPYFPCSGCDSGGGAHEIYHKGESHFFALLKTHANLRVALCPHLFEHSCHDSWNLTWFDCWRVLPIHQQVRLIFYSAFRDVSRRANFTGAWLNCVKWLNPV